MTNLTTHVLDIYSGKPGEGIKVDLYYIQDSKRKKLNSILLNKDGRADKPLIEGENFKEGQYEIVFFDNCAIFWSIVLASHLIFVIIKKPKDLEKKSI